MAVFMQRKRVIKFSQKKRIFPLKQDKVRKNKFKSKK